MEAKNKSGHKVKLEHVLSVGLIGDKSKMQTLIINRQDGRTDIPILRVVGNATSHEVVKPKDGSTNRRDTTYIKGKFQGHNLVNETRYISGQVILPDSAAAFIVASLPTDVDVTINLVRSEKSIVGYKFTADLNNVVLDAIPDEEEAINKEIETVTQETNGEAEKGKAKARK